MGIDKSGVEFVNQLQNLCNGYQVWKTDNTNISKSNVGI